MGGMNTNIADAFKSNINLEGYKKTNDMLQAVGVGLCDLDEAASVCASLTFGAGTNLVNGACVPVDQGWSALYGIS